MTSLLAAWSRRRQVRWRSRRVGRARIQAL